MISPLVIITFASLMQAGPAQAVLVSRESRPKSIADSIRALKRARSDQADFEWTRKANLPREYGVAGHRCDVHVGRWCIWNDESNDRDPPPESPHIKDARNRLLARLDTLGAALPGDEWIASQQVRYLLEAGRHADAVRIADRCTASGSTYLCSALAALAYHDSGAVAAADSAFSVALAAMPDSVRCQWTDISKLLDGGIADRFEHADCSERQRIATDFWRLTTPLYLRNHDWRNEFLARVTRAEMERDSRTPSGSPEEPAYRETALRYGFDTWFVRDDPPMGSMAEPSIAGFRGSGSGYNFVPDDAAFDSPASLRIDDWTLRLPSAQTNYAPPYAKHFHMLAQRQIALFRRGDSALVVATYDVSDDTLFARDSLEAGLFTASVDSMTIGEAKGQTNSDASARGVLMTRAAWKPMIVSLEVLNPKTRSAERARFGVRPAAATAGLAHSDILLFTPPSGDSLPRRLNEALSLSLNGERVRGQRVGLFWEIYGVRSEGETVGVTITIDRIREGVMRRAAERLHLATPFSPVQLQWKEMPDPENGIASRAVTLDLSHLSNGHYEIAVAAARPGEAPVVSRRQIVIDR